MTLAGLLHILPRPPRLNRDHRLIVEPAGDPEDNYRKKFARARERKIRDAIATFEAFEDQESM